MTQELAVRTLQRAEVLATAHPLEGEHFRVFVHDLRTGPPKIATPAVVITDPPYPVDEAGAVIERIHGVHVCKGAK